MPKRIGRYEAFLQIGAGGMARVYLAVQRAAPGQTGQTQLVVVKILRPEAIEDEHVLALFMDEARIATRLQHPNVIRTREVIAEAPDYLLAMDFQNGQSLLHVLRRLGRQGVPRDEHVYILTKVLAGLSYAHELKDDDGQPFGIVHRDVSPANVLVSYTGEVKLLDFGIAKATGALAATQDGVVKGKMGYAAPEQCLGKPADPRSDIYAVGVMLWEAIAGRRRASGETWQSVLQARLDDSEPQLEEVCPDAPAMLATVARRALAREPEDRYTTAREFQRDLEKYLVAQGAKVGPGH
ncbi:MAG TPA: serine/threonine-protein kinase, partial [Polyangiaceae bacterium]|nr:serine/threonine-protein kinase [Polyangiaceae bacterium]